MRRIRKTLSEKEIAKIHKQVWIIDAALDSPCFRNNQVFRSNPKWWGKWRLAVSALRKIEPFFPRLKKPFSNSSLTIKQRKVSCKGINGASGASSQGEKT